MRRKEIIIGTRGSKLALWQAYFIKEKIEKFILDVPVRIKVIKTQGDKYFGSLSKIAGKGVFIKEIEQELIKNSIDIAVHSVKDIPTEIPSELVIGAVPERSDPRDVLISKKNKKLSELPENCVIATGSLRRRVQILSVKNDISFIEIRGNIDTRLRIFHQSKTDGMILAKAGLERMNFLDEISEIISENICLPAAGQGALGIEIRKNDEFMSNIAEKLNYRDSEISVNAERAFLKRLGGGCQIPIGVLARVVGEKLIIKGMLSSLDGKEIIRDEVTGDISEPENYGILLAEKVLSYGEIR